MSKIPSLDGAPPAEPMASGVLHDQVATLLAELAELTPDEIAGRMTDRGVCGGNLSHPLARWLTRKIGPGGSAWLSGRGGSVHVVLDPAAEALVPLPEQVGAFVHGFDAGAYPQLVLPLGPDLIAQVRCGCGYLLPASEALAGFTSCEWCATGRTSPVAAAAEAVTAVGPPPANQYDTVTIPAVPAGVDSGQVLVRVALICSLGALAAFLLAAGGVLQLAGAIAALAWPVATALLLFLRPRPRREYAAQHRTGYRPVHAVVAAR